MATSKITNLSVADTIISGQTALGAAPADTDEFLVSDAGTLKRVDYSYIKGITQASFLPNVEPLIINGNMSVAQRGTSATSISSVNGYYTCDRMAMEINGLGTWTQTQEALTTGDAFADGFKNAIKLDCTTADASPAAGDSLSLVYKFESQDLQVLKKGTANAEKMTLSFWVKSTKTGTFIAEFYDHDNTRQISTAYTVSVSDTWEKKVINIAADTTGALANDNGAGIYIYMWLGAGSTYTSGTLSTTWTTPVNGDRAAGQVNIADNTSNNFHLTGLQLEVGEYTAATLPPFKFSSYGDNLLRCQRYYENSYRLGHYPGDSVVDGGSYSGFLYSTDFLVSFFPFKVNKRDNPTMTFYDRNGTAGKWYGGVYQVSEAIDNIVVSLNTTTGWMGTISSVAANTNEGHGYYVADAEL